MCNCLCEGVMKMQKGDIILVADRSYRDGKFNKIWSFFVGIIQRSKYSHVGIAVDSKMIIEAIASGVVCRENKYSHYDVYRIKDITLDQINRMVEFAQSEVGDAYDWKALIYLGWLYITFRKDQANAWQDENKWLCSELISYIARSVGYILWPHCSDDAGVAPENIADSALTYYVETVG